jgi:Fe-S-cluster containining protein
LEIITDLKIIQLHAIEKENVNDQFISFLKGQPADEIDHQVHGLSAGMTLQIDCTQCGNCCRSLMIQVNEQEITQLSVRLNMSEETFTDQYVEKGMGAQMIMNTIPCHFLEDNKCLVYEDRFSGCREFPALHLPQVTSRLFTIFMHYGRCPIIYNVMEALKERLNFNSAEVVLSDH